MKPDLLICWIKHTDYPYFRAFLKKYRSFFGKIIILFSEHMQFPYFDHFLQNTLEPLGNIQFLDPANIRDKDWRNVATNEMLKYSTGEWVCSVEQDWFCKDWDEILSKIEEKAKEVPLLGWASKSGANGYYIHPAFWFCKRELLEKTNKNFAAERGEDHFGHITKDVQKLGYPTYDLESEFNCQVNTEADCFHLGGVNQNYLRSDDPTYVFHRAEPFYVYNYWCRKTNVEQDPKFVFESNRVEKILYNLYPEMELENNGWIKYFKI